MDLQFHQLLIRPDSIEIQPLNLIDIVTESYEDEQSGETAPKKRTRNESEWVRVKRKIARQAGQEYVNSRNVLVKAKKFTYKICEKCPFKCTTKITYEAAKSIHDEFWKLNDNLKSRFYEKTTFKEFKKRERKRIPSNESRRTYSFLYYFHVGKEKIRVCRDFYVKTLNISARRVARFHEKVFEGVALPHMDGRGRSTKNKIPNEVRQKVRDHINSFPYEQLLECKNLVKTPTALNVVKMYEMYCQKCKEDDIEPSKLWLYRKIFQDEMYYKENPDAIIPQDFCHYVEDDEEEPDDEPELLPEMLNVEIKEEPKAIETKQFEYKKCNSKCPYQCSQKFDYDAAKKIYGDFWKMSSYDKNNFYNTTTVRETRERKSKTGRTKFIFEFYFYLNGEKMRVCRDFYLTTLCISLARIVYFYKIKLARVETKNIVDYLPKECKDV